MNTLLLRQKLSFLILLALSVVSLGSPSALAIELLVTIENIGPSNGVAITPVWVGLHDGTFDSYDPGTAAAPFLEILAEDGATGLISTEFNMTAGRVDATIGSASGPPPLSAGESASMVLSGVATDGSNEFFSYASMILPSNDFFLANGDPMARSIASLYNSSVGTDISFVIGTPGTVNDAGTEEEDFDFVAPGTGPLQNVLFPGRNFDANAGQNAGNQGPSDATTTVENVVGADPFGGFLNILGADLSGFDFNDAALYSGGGIARITITVVPEPTSVALAGLGVVGLCGMMRRRR